MQCSTGCRDDGCNWFTTDAVVIISVIIIIIIIVIIFMIDIIIIITTKIKLDDTSLFYSSHLKLGL